MKNPPSDNGILGEPSVKNVPRARRSHSMVFDSIEQNVVLFGGSLKFGLINELWLLSLSSKSRHQKVNDCNLNNNCFSGPIFCPNLCQTAYSQCFPEDPPQSSSLSTTSPQETNSRRRPIIRRGNFWTDNMYIVLSIIFAIWIFLFQIGFSAGYFIEEQRGDAVNLVDQVTSTSSTNTSSSYRSYSYHMEKSSNCHSITASTTPSGVADSFTNNTFDSSSLVVPSETSNQY